MDHHLSSNGVLEALILPNLEDTTISNVAHTLLRIHNTLLMDTATILHMLVLEATMVLDGSRGRLQCRVLRTRVVVGMTITVDKDR